jgi:hypothetical protein
MKSTLHTIFSLGILLQGHAFVLSAQTNSPKEALKRFCELDTNGGQFNPEGWASISKFFIEPGPPSIKSVSIVRRDYVITDGDPVLGDKTDMYVEYARVGQIEYPSLRILDWSPIMVRWLSVLVKVHPDGADKRTEWRISGKVIQPYVTLDTARRLAPEWRDQAKDPRVRENAEKLIAVLNHPR